MVILSFKNRYNNYKLKYKNIYYYFKTKNILIFKY